MNWDQANTIMCNYAKLQLSHKPSCGETANVGREGNINEQFHNYFCVRCTVFIVDVCLSWISCCV